MGRMNRRPYFNRFNPENNWGRLGFLPDRALQASELNELQSLLGHHVKKIGDIILDDGNVTEGLTWAVDEDRNVIVEPGEIYMEGKVRIYEGEIIALKPDEPVPDKLYARLDKKIITEKDNEDLLDKNSSLPNYFSPGAHRLEERVRIIVNPVEGADVVEVQKTLSPMMSGTITSVEEPPYLGVGGQWHEIT